MVSHEFLQVVIYDVLMVTLNVMLTWSEVDNFIYLRRIFSPTATSNCKFQRDLFPFACAQRFLD